MEYESETGSPVLIAEEFNIWNQKKSNKLNNSQNCEKLINAANL